MADKFPEEYTVPNPYNLPVHDQGNKNNCSSHAFASLLEYQLSAALKQRILIDVDDLWEKQLKYGTAIEEVGDFIDGPFNIATVYGVKFKTDEGKTGKFFLSNSGWRIKMDGPFRKIISFFTTKLKRKEEIHKPTHLQLEYNAAISNAYNSGTKKLNSKNVELRVRFENSTLADVIENSLSEIDEIGVELIDQEKIQRFQEEVNIRYGGRRLGGIGGAPVSDIIANGLIVFTFWSLAHILEDVDDLAWQKVKSGFVKILKSTKDIETDNREITIEFRNPQILFVFPKTLSEDIFSNEINKIREIVRTIHKDSSSSDLPRKYLFNPETREWVLETRRLKW